MILNKRKARALKLTTVMVGASLLATSVLAGASEKNAQSHNAKSYTGGLCDAAQKGQKCITILLDHMQRIKIAKPASVVMIGNPAIADITMLDPSIAFISAKSIGATNMVALDGNGDEIVNYQILVREPQVKRVSIRRAFTKENYQCAPDCNRALSMTDTQEAFSETSGIVATRMGMNQQTTPQSPETVEGTNLSTNDPTHGSSQ